MKGKSTGQTDFGRFPKLASTQGFLVFSIPFEGAVYEDE